MAPGECRMGLGQQLRVMPGLFSNGPRVAVKAVRWLGVWARRDPDERHWHLGPISVDSHLQGRGVGSKLMEVFCARVDAAGEDAYLETDKAINVRFYERFGFEVVGEQEVVGLPNWYMLRPARGGNASSWKIRNLGDTPGLRAHHAPGGAIRTYSERRK